MATVVQGTLYAKQPLSYKTQTATLLLKTLISTYPTLFIAIRKGTIWGDPDLKSKRVHLVTKSGGKRKEFLDAQLLDNKVMRYEEALAPAYKTHLPDPNMSDATRLKLMKKVYGGEFSMDTLVTVMTFTDWKLSGLFATEEGFRKLHTQLDKEEKDARYKSYATMTPEELEEEAERVATEWDERWNSDWNAPVITITGRYDEDHKLKGKDSAELKFNFTIEGLSEWDLEVLFEKGFPFNSL